MISALKYLPRQYLSFCERMARNKPLGKKLRLAAAGKVRSAPRWADIRKFGLKRARTRRIRTPNRRWRRDRLKA